MDNYITNHQTVDDIVTWIQGALNNSSMALESTAQRGLGIRREYDEKLVDVNPVGAVPKFAILPNQLLNKQGQGTYIANPFYEVDVCKNGIGKAGKNGPDQLVNVEKIKEAGVVLPQNANYTLESLVPGNSYWKGMPPLSERPAPSAPKGLTPDKLAELNAKYCEEIYIPWGSKRFSRSDLQKNSQNPEFYGLCDGFTAVTISGLVESTTFTKIGGQVVNNPTPIGTLVECFRCVVGGQGMAHTFTIVNRSPASTLNDPYTWGEFCFVIDHWYGLQKPMAGETVTSIYKIRNKDVADSKDKQYLKDITQAPTMFDKKTEKTVPNPFFKKLRDAEVSFEFRVKKWGGAVFSPANRELTKPL